MATTRRGRIPIPGTFEPGFEPERITDRGFTTIDRRRTKWFTMGRCVILVGREPVGENGELLWHFSISRDDRHPSWDEIKTARYRLLPAELTFGILLPPPESYVNVEAQDHVFHLWEITDPRAPWLVG